MEDLRDYKTVDLWIKKASGSEVTTRVYLNKFLKKVFFGVLYLTQIMPQSVLD